MDKKAYLESIHIAAVYLSYLNHRDLKWKRRAEYYRFVISISYNHRVSTILTEKLLFCAMEKATKDFKFF